MREKVVNQVAGAVAEAIDQWSDAAEVVQRVEDQATYDPEGGWYYLSNEPGGWTQYERVHLTDEERAEVIRRAEAIARGDDDLLGAEEIAQRAGVSTITVYKWVERHQDFPATVSPATAARRFWRWGDVAEWLASTGRVKA